jgi:hypothetical protein
MKYAFAVLWCLLLVPRLRLGTQGPDGSASARAAAGRACQAGRVRAEPGHEGIKYVTVLLMGFAFCGVSGWHLPAFAEDAQAPGQTTPAFYRWLDKYQNPALRTDAQKPSPQAEAVSKSTNNLENQQSTAMTETPASPTEVPPLQVDWANEPTGPGEGFGCFYHRSYYSHLPLFDKGNTYTLPGSLDVAEPNQRLPR